MIVVLYDFLFLNIYIVTSLAICVYEKYNFRKPLRIEMSRGLKSFCIQLPLSNLAMYFCSFGTRFSIWGCLQYIFLFDLLVFVFHYMLHTNKWLYDNVHKVHHKTIHVSPFSATILDPLEHIIIGILPTMLPLLVVDIDIIGWTLTNACIFIHGLLIHSTIMIPYDTVLLGPREHATHHIFKRTHYGFINPLWDIVCGTATYPITRTALIDSIVAAY